MFRFLRGIVLIAAVVMMNCGFVFADSNSGSANNYMPGCRAHIAMVDNKPYDTSLFFNQGCCMGTIQGILSVLMNICAPPRVTQTQMIRVVVKYIDDRPARLNENFNDLTVEALVAAWPCKK
jgi:hypothetical protein